MHCDMHFPYRNISRCGFSGRYSALYSNLFAKLIILKFLAQFTINRARIGGILAWDSTTPPKMSDQAVVLIVNTPLEASILPIIP